MIPTTLVIAPSRQYWFDWAAAQRKLADQAGTLVRGPGQQTDNQITTTRTIFRYAPHLAATQGILFTDVIRLGGRDTWDQEEYRYLMDRARRNSY